MSSGGHFKATLISTFYFILVSLRSVLVVSNKFLCVCIWICIFFMFCAVSISMKVYLPCPFAFAVLCLLANFDDEHGVVGLADAFPMFKVFLGGVFALSFVICRVFMWSTASYYYCRDAHNALNGSDPRMKRHIMWFRFTFLSLSILSLLQIIWLAEIVRVGIEELKKVGLL